MIDAAERAIRDEDALREKVAFLADPRRARRSSRTVEVIETHFAWVFLVGDRAYKLKKPVRQASMDYRTLAARQPDSCEILRVDFQVRMTSSFLTRVTPGAAHAVCCA